MRYVGAGKARSSVPRSSIGAWTRELFIGEVRLIERGSTTDPEGWGGSRLGTMSALGAARRKPSPARWVILADAQWVLTVLLVRANRPKGCIEVRARGKGGPPIHP